MECVKWEAWGYKQGRTLELNKQMITIFDIIVSLAVMFIRTH